MVAVLPQPVASRPERLWYQCRLRWLVLLQWLSLHDSNVTDLATKHLESLSQLQVLILQNTTVTDSAIAHLQKLQQLQLLDLRETEVTSEGVARLQAVLPDCRIKTRH